MPLWWRKSAVQAFSFQAISRTRRKIWSRNSCSQTPPNGLPLPRPWNTLGSPPGQFTSSNATSPLCWWPFPRLPVSMQLDDGGRPRLEPSLHHDDFSVCPWRGNEERTQQQVSLQYQHLLLQPPLPVREGNDTLACLKEALQTTTVLTSLCAPLGHCKSNVCCMQPR